jgi:ribosomal-protein-alanine N-acetyltransferase
VTLPTPQKLTLTDAPALARLHQSTLAEAWDAASFEQMLQQPGVGGWKLEQNGTLLAFLLFRTVLDESELLTLVTASTHRHRGMARRLLSAWQAEDRARIREVYLEVRISNNAAIRLYSQTGFIPCGKRRAYYPDGEDALLMRWPWQVD